MASILSVNATEENVTVDLAAKSLNNLKRVQVATWGLTTVGSYDRERCFVQCDSQEFLQ